MVRFESKQYEDIIRVPFEVSSQSREARFFSLSLSNKQSNMRKQRPMTEANRQLKLK